MRRSDDPESAECAPDAGASQSEAVESTAGSAGSESSGHVDESSGDSAPANGWQGLMPETFQIRLPGPRRPDRAGIGRVARFSGRLGILSPRTPAMPAWGVIAASVGWSALVGLLVAFLLTLLAGAVDPSVRLSTLVWLVAHHAPLTTDVGAVSLLPLGLLVIVALPLRRAGRFVAAQAAGRFRLRTVAVTCVVAYAALAGTLALLAGSTPPSVSVASAVLWCGVVASASGAWGVIRQNRGGLPIPTFVVGVGTAVAVPLAAGATLAVAALLASVPQIVAAQAGLAESAVDQAGLLLMQVGYLPNLVVWGAAFVAGSGFTLGSDHRLSPFAAGDVVLPELPILAAVPTETPSWSAALPILVALGGVLGALAFARRVPEHRLRRRISRAVILALASGAVWWVLTFLSGGSLGGGRLEAVGPAAGTVLLATVLTLAGTLLWALLPTLASDAKPVALDLRDRVSSAAVAAKEVTEAKIPSGRKG